MFRMPQRVIFCSWNNFIISDYSRNDYKSSTTRLFLTFFVNKCNNKLMIKFFQDKLLAGFLIALFGSIITFGYQYLQDSYKQSRLVLDYKHEYSQVGNVSVGNIVIANLGQVSDEDIMVQVDEKVDKYNVQISGASTEPQVKRFNDYTEFVISKLNPFDRISISFTPTSKRSSFEILSFNSKSGKL